jgi:serine/threonine protein kinase
MDTSIWNEYDKITILGISLFGIVYKGRRKKDNKIVSIKEYKRYQDRAIETYEKDVKYMEELKSDYTIKKIDVKQTNDHSYIIREYCYGSLEEFIKSHDDGMKPFEIQKILNQLIVPFKKLNEKKLIHKDIKPSNILFSFKGLNDFKAKLSGIYFCSKLGEEDNGMKGMRYITPPEGLKGEPINMKYDVWSVGVLIYFMIKGKYPFEGTKDLIVLNAIENGIDLKNLSGDKDLDELIEKCLQKDVEKRISWEDFFKDKFLSKKFPEKKKKKRK